MEGQNILEKVESIEKEKTEKQQLKEQKAKQKLTVRRSYFITAKTSVVAPVSVQPKILDSAQSVMRSKDLCVAKALAP